MFEDKAKKQRNIVITMIVLKTLFKIDVTFNPPDEFELELFYGAVTVLNEMLPVTAAEADDLNYVIISSLFGSTHSMLTYQSSKSAMSKFITVPSIGKL